MSFTKIPFCILAMVLFLTSCSTDTPVENEPPSGSGNLKISLTDAPGDFDAVNITFSEISAHLNNEWLTQATDTQTVNLLEFTNGRTVELSSAVVPIGKYTQVRVKLLAAEVVIKAQTFPLDVPSASKTGLKLVSPFEIREGVSTELILDFDACRSVIRTGPPRNPSYKLKPTIRLVKMDSTGSISGIVTNPENAPTAYALANGDTITTSAVDVDDGDFKLAFLPEGIYTVAIRDTLAQAFEQSGVSVTARENTDIGAVTLQ